MGCCSCGGNSCHNSTGKESKITGEKSKGPKAELKKKSASVKDIT